MGKPRNVDMSSQEVKVKIVASPDDTAETAVEKSAAVAGEETAKKPAKPRQQRVRSQKYAAVKSKVDRNRKYDALSALELVKQLSYSKFEGTIVADIEVIDTEVTAEVTLPHSTGKQQRVTVVTDEVIKQIEAGQLDFDVLVSAPEFMPKLAKHAKVLGPKGLMPNPKNGTLSPNPERAAKELAGGKQLLKTEKKQPLIHVTLGKTSLETKQLIENLRALAEALSAKLVGITVSATMSPGVKVDPEAI
jgi:large subunit ribosomal protein L1